MTAREQRFMARKIPYIASVKPLEDNSSQPTEELKSENIPLTKPDKKETQLIDTRDKGDQKESKSSKVKKKDS